MTKADKIARFIKKTNPRRKELVKFIVVNLNKKMTSKEFDNLPSQDSIHAYYATNITKWKYRGNVSVDAKTKRYSLTKNYNGSLYSLSSKVRVERAEKVSKNWEKLYYESKREVAKLRAEKQDLQRGINLALYTLKPLES